MLVRASLVMWTGLSSLLEKDWAQRQGKLLKEVHKIGNLRKGFSRYCLLCSEANLRKGRR